MTDTNQKLRKAFDIEGARQFLASFANWRPDPLNDDRHYRALATALDYLCDLIGPQALALPTAVPANRASLQSGADARDAERYRWLTSDAADSRLASTDRDRELIYKAWSAIENSTDKTVIDTEIDAAMRGVQP